MNRCNRCKIDIVDDTVVCPICHSVVRRGDVMDKAVESSAASSDVNGNVTPDENVMADENGTPGENVTLDKNVTLDESVTSDENMTPDENGDDFNKYPSHSIMYPDITHKMKRMRFAVKLVVFLSILVETVLIMLNRWIGRDVRWSAICGVGLIYICFTLIYSFLYQRGHRRKIMYQAIGVMVLCVAIDCLLGYRGWSLEFAIPCTVLVLDLSVIIIMIFNLNNFQMYIMMQMSTVLISTVLLIIVYASELADFVILAVIAEIVSVLLFLGMLVFGDRKARAELSRRFRI